MAFCSNCGTQLNEGTAFCQNCGASLQGQKVPAQQAPVQETYIPQPIYTAQTPPAKKSKKTGAVVAVIVALLLVIAALTTVLVVTLLDDKDSGKGSGGSSVSGTGEVTGDAVTGDKPETEIPNTSSTYKEVALAFGEAASDYDYERMTGLCLFDEEKILEDYMELKGLDEADVCDIFEEYFDEMGFSIRVGDLDDVYKGIAKMYEMENSDYEIKSVKIGDAEELELDDAIEAIGEFSRIFEYTGLDMFDYVDSDDITEGYQVDLTATIEEESGTEKETESIVVVKYNGKWKVIGNSFALLGVVYEAIE